MKEIYNACIFLICWLILKIKSLPKSLECVELIEMAIETFDRLSRITKNKVFFLLALSIYLFAYKWYFMK